MDTREVWKSTCSRPCSATGRAQVHHRRTHYLHMLAAREHPIPLVNLVAAHRQTPPPPRHMTRPKVRPRATNHRFQPLKHQPSARRMHGRGKNLRICIRPFDRNLIRCLTTNINLPRDPIPPFSPVRYCNLQRCIITKMLGLTNLIG